MADLVIEQQLQDMFSKILRVDNVLCSDSFLDLGGDSISAILCISRIRKLFDVELFIEDFFSDDSTATALAELIEKERNK